MVKIKQIRRRISPDNGSLWKVPNRNLKTEKIYITKVKNSEVESNTAEMITVTTTVYTFFSSKIYFGVKTDTLNKSNSQINPDDQHQMTYITSYQYLSQVYLFR